MNDQRKIRRLVDKKDAARVKKAVDKVMPEDSRVYEEIGRGIG